MFNQSHDPATEYPRHKIRESARDISFKAKRRARRKNRVNKQMKNALSLKNKRGGNELQKKAYVGPTQETAAKLTPDPLVIFKRKNILNDQQIWAFQHIRRAIQIITDGTRIRISHFSDLPVQTSRNQGRLAPCSESEYEIRIKHHYSDWIDRMMAAGLAAGPVLDIIIDELSLSSTDRKRGKRKGWAKTHLQQAMDLYNAFPAAHDRNK